MAAQLADPAALQHRHPVGVVRGVQPVRDGDHGAPGENRGEGPLSSLYPIANLGKARALNDTAEYDKFFNMWKDADADIPA